MRERYAGRWPESVTFVQKSTFHQPDGSTREETWYEAIASPSMLRIDIAPVEQGNGIIFRNDSLYRFKSGSLAAATRQIHPLLVLSRAVYFVPTDETVAKLRELGFDLTKLREDTWQGRPVYVVGADAGDLESPQFWIDQERLYFVRLIRPVKQKPGATEEIQFNRYQPLGGGWIEGEVIFNLDGRLAFHEEYFDVRQPEEGLGEEPFDPGRWAPPAWIEQR